MKRILLADDHVFIRLGLIQILKDEYPFVEIQEVADGAALLKEVLHHDFDLVITDLDMPGRNGLEVLEQLKLAKPSLPVLVLSIFPEDLYAIRVLKAGGDGYLNKNAAAYELVTAVQRIMQGRKYIPPEVAEKLLQYKKTFTLPHDLLTNRELEIFKLLAAGKTISYIADKLSLAHTTVSTHRAHILAKLGVASNPELTRYALANRILLV